MAGQSEPLRCFELNLSAITAEYRPMDKPLFPGIGLGLVCWDGLFEKQANPWVRWTDASGELIPTGDERAKQEATRANTEQSRANSEQVRANQEQARANTATARAETERSRADAEKTRADALAARLRALGVNPGE